MPSSFLELYRVDAGNLIDVETILADLRNYSQRVDGEPRRTGAATEFATALPAGSLVCDKHAFVAHRNGLPVGLLDIINRYPAPGSAFIGLLAVREGLHGIGLGRALYMEAEKFALNHLEARTIRIGVVETNAVTGFWQRMGFKATGEVKPHRGTSVSSRAILMEKTLS